MSACLTGGWSTCGGVCVLLFPLSSPLFRQRVRLFRKRRLWLPRVHPPPAAHMQAPGTLPQKTTFITSS